MAEAIPFIIGGMQAASVIVGGIGESQSLSAQKDVAKVNERYALQDSITELKLANLESNRVRREARETIAEQFAGLAQSGLGASDSSSALMLEESGKLAELDALTVRYKGELASRQRMVAANAFDYEARAADSAKKGIPFKVALGAATAMLSGAAKGMGGKVA